MIIDTSAQIRVIRTYLGMSSRDFATRLGVSVATVTAWEHGKNTPVGKARHVLGQLCQEHGIGVLPSGMPIPMAECFAVRPGTWKGWDTPPPPETEGMRPPEGGHESGADPKKRASAGGWDPHAWPASAPR